MYRKRALENRGGAFSNPITISGNVSINLTVIGLFVVLAVAVAFACTTSYIRRITVTGYIDPAGGQVAVNSHVSGQLALVAENGALVNSGDLLAAVTRQDLSAAGVSRSDEEITALDQQLGIIEAESGLIRQRLDAVEKQTVGDRTLAANSRRIAELQLELVRSEIALTEATMERQETLKDRNLASETEVALARQALLTARQREAETIGRLDVLDNETAQRALDRREQKLALQQALVALDKEAANLNARIATLRSENVAGIFAPADGVLSILQAQDREVVNAGQPLFVIEPEGSELVGILLAPSSAIGFVEAGDTVQIRYRAFPYREHGIFEGVVQSIDSTAQLPEDIDAPIQIGEPVYRIKVSLDQAPRNKAGKTLRLSSGMLLDASVVIDRKLLIFWILDPVL